MRNKYYFLIAGILCLFLLIAAAPKSDSTKAVTAEDDTTVVPSESIAESSLVLILHIEDAIGTVTADRVIDAVEQAEQEHADLLVITIDTPGGFVSAVWPITKAIMNSNVPVVVYVYPSGGRAASAGVYITYAAHIAAMAPGTNIGAAHVVSGGQEMDSVMSEKVMNDAVASLRGMAERNGRNGEWAEEAARRSVSITNSEALEKNVINLIANDVDDLLEQVDGMEVNMVLGTKTVEINNPIKRTIKETFIQSVLEIITSPNIVFILFSIGGLGIVLELYNPGSILPGVVGGISLILAFYGMRTLPINYAGVLLLVFALILFILEVKVASHGLLTLGGVISVIIGGMMLIDTADPDLKISRAVIFTVAVVLGGFFLFVFSLAFRARIAQPTTGAEGLVGLVGVVRTKIDTNGYIYLAGELWEAMASEPIEEGAEVEVLEVDKLKLKVKRKT